MFQETVVLDGGVRYELRFRSPADYRLACVKDGRALVVYAAGGNYELRSVEKLRYDFERDAQDALHPR
jgi:hypothetical protein